MNSISSGEVKNVSTRDDAWATSFKHRLNLVDKREACQSPVLWCSLLRILSI